MTKWQFKPPAGGQNKFERRQEKMVRLDKWAMSFDKKPAQPEDPHKNNPAPIYGGCGNPGCDICYRGDGSLRADSGKYQGGNPGSDANYVAADSSRDPGPTREESERVYAATGSMGAVEDFERMSPSARQQLLNMLSREPAQRSPGRYSMPPNRVMDWMIDPSYSPTPKPQPNPKTAELNAMNEAKGDIEKYLLATEQTLQWTDVIGNERARIELQEAIEASTTHADTYKFYEMTPPKGVMLYGPPGCGKTMFAKASAAAVSRLYGKASELLVINGAELEAPIVGIAAQRVKAIFKYAAAYRAYHDVPLVIFIDEADAVLKSRESAPWTAELVGTFLGEMDGLNQSGAFIILATNRPDELDQALLREGRIDRKIKIARPTMEDAKAILHHQLRNLPSWAGELSINATIEELFSPTNLLRKLTNPSTNRDHHFNLHHIVSGAMIVGLLARAKSRAFRRDIAANARSGVTQEDMLAAVAEVFEENKGLDHAYALREFVEEVALPAEALKNLN